LEKKPIPTIFLPEEPIY